MHRADVELMYELNSYELEMADVRPILDHMYKGIYEIRKKTHCDVKDVAIFVSGCIYGKLRGANCQYIDYDLPSMKMRFNGIEIQRMIRLPKNEMLIIYTPAVCITTFSPFTNPMWARFETDVMSNFHDDRLDTLRYTLQPAILNSNLTVSLETEEEKMLRKLKIKKVIYNEPATIVYWEDGTKTVVKAQLGESFDKEKGLAMAMIKRLNDNKGSYNNIFRKWCE